jgi:hypothetical protein
VTHCSVGKPPDGSLYGNQSVTATPKLFVSTFGLTIRQIGAAAQADQQTRAQPSLQSSTWGTAQMANQRQHNSMVADGALAVPIDATYPP